MNDSFRDRSHRGFSDDPLLPGMKLDQIGQALASCYDNLVAEGLPDHLAALVRRVDLAERSRSGKAERPDAPIAVVVEDERDTRELAESVLEETEMRVIGCDSAENALGILRERGARWPWSSPISASPAPWTGFNSPAPSRPSGRAPGWS
ncbi:hypothetical protein GCM10025880_55600 [Methylorubrum aminovorans]|nr:hypothetical protein GCM10025880_55600 [Methylorubrum aminovorans]